MENLLSVAHFTPNHGVIVDFINAIFAKHNISADKFERMRGERFADRETRDLSNFVTLFVSTEHNVILPGGTNMPKAPLPGTLLAFDNVTNYLVANVEPEGFAKSDIVLDYSKLNIYNMKSSGFFDAEYLDKIIYVPALPFTPIVTPSIPRNNTKNEVIATFAYTNPRGDRRTEVIEALVNRGIKATMHHFRNLTELCNLYDDSKILVNVHQTYWHHTLEEFRILPALQRGLIVVSEWVPARFTIPFSEYIVFAPYDKLAETVVEVYQHYDEYYEKFFGLGSMLPSILSKELAESYQHLERRVLKSYQSHLEGVQTTRSALQIPMNRTLLMQGSSNSIYLFQHGKRCEFQSLSDFSACGYQLGQQLRFPEATLALFPVSGPCIPPCR